MVHIDNLRYYLKSGLVLRKVHRILRFSQERWISPYVELCTKKRQLAKTSFEKDFWKLLVNSLYGKSIEDKRKHVKVQLVLNEAAASKKVRKNQFDQFHILDENKALFKMKNVRVLLNRPIYIGFTVLELSKLLMFRLHYEHFKKFYKSDINLAYTDTDSFIYHIKTENIHLDFKNVFSSIMDFCDYPKDHFLHTDINKKRIGFIKDELNGAQIREFIGLRPKMYIIVKEGQEDTKRAKGVKKSVVEKEINFEHFRMAIFENKFFTHTMNRLQSKNHKIFALSVKKLSVSPLDDKRFILNDRIHTLAHGHYKILKNL